jgi:hopanoid C-2 methylase
MSAPRSRKRILVVNAYFDDARKPTRRPTTVLKAMGPPFLAGAFDRTLCEVKLYDEQSSGPLEKADLLGWPDMLVLTGLTAAFDRMLHLTAYARTLNSRVIVVAGGPAIRLLHEYSKAFFDYSCRGDVEEMLEVIDDAFGKGYADPMMRPRYDLAYWIRSFGHVESTRNCNFSCSFCSLTAENNDYFKVDLAQLRRQIEACGKRKFMLFIDNNFYGNDRNHFLARLELIREMRDRGWFGGFGALVTSDFFLHPENVHLARKAGCEALFCGVETFDADSLRRFNKRQNTVIPQVEMFNQCLDAGILLVYGLIADVHTRTLREIEDELRFVTSCRDLTLPTFVVLPIPFPGTPTFRQAAAAGELLPNTHLRDLDGTTLCVRPIDPVGEVAAFVRGLQHLRGHRLRALTHAFGFLRRYHRTLNTRQLAISFARDLSLAGMPLDFRAGRAPLAAILGRRGRPRSHVSTTEVLDDSYTPAFPVAYRYKDHFTPTPITDASGNLAANLADELLGAACAQPRSSARISGS